MLVLTTPTNRRNIPKCPWTVQRTSQKDDAPKTSWKKEILHVRTCWEYTWWNYATSKPRNHLTVHRRRRCPTGGRSSLHQRRKTSTQRQRRMDEPTKKKTKRKRLTSPNQHRRQIKNRTMQCFIHTKKPKNRVNQLSSKNQLTRPVVWPRYMIKNDSWIVYAPKMVLPKYGFSKRTQDTIHQISSQFLDHLSEMIKESYNFPRYLTFFPCKWLFLPEDIGVHAQTLFPINGQSGLSPYPPCFSQA